MDSLVDSSHPVSRRFYMKKAWINLIAAILSIFLIPFALAETVSLFQIKQIPVKAEIQYNNDILTITNKSKHPINLNNGRLSFHYQGTLSSIQGINLSVRPTIRMQDVSRKPNACGNSYRVDLNEINQPIIYPEKSIQLKFARSEKNETPHGFKLFTIERVPVQVKVTTENKNWVETISVCNISSNSVPLKDIEFNFNYGVNAPNNYWGQPWAAWKLASQVGTQVVLIGGTPWTPNLASDPNCTKPLTIQFNAPPANPDPMGPFVFKSAGATPSGSGSLTITLQSAPTNGLPNPQVTVTGMGTSSQQVVQWGNQWQLTNLVPGSYNISATAVDNGTDFFQAIPSTVTVNNQANTQALLQYQAVPSGEVTVTLSNAPAAVEPVTFTGQKYTIRKDLPASSIVKLPQDTYTVSSIVPGYTTTILPNPLIVPSNTSLSITYQQTTVTTTPKFVGYFESWDGDSQ